MSFTLSRLTLALLACFFCGVSFAQSSPPQTGSAAVAQRRDPGQDATVIVDGSAVYAAPNFDAPVKEYLDRGKKVRISRKLYPGVGGLGAFYRIRLGPGSFGYITDVDIEVAKAGAAGRPAQAPRGNSGDPLEIQRDLERSEVPSQMDSIYLAKYLGLTYASLSYAETIAKKKRSASTGLIGAKMSGPTSYLGGMPLDLELVLLSGAPSFYDEVASKTSGFLFMGHALAMFPLMEKTTQMIYYAFGPMAKYAIYDIKLTNGSVVTKPVDSQEISLGATLALGYAVRLGRQWALRLDGRFTYEKESYSGFSLSLQRKM